MTEFKDWYNSVPFFTRYWLTFTIGLSIIGRFGIISYYYFILDFYPFIYQFQVCYIIMFLIAIDKSDNILKSELKFVFFSAYLL